MGIDINFEVNWKYRKRSYRYQSEIMENWSKSDMAMDQPTSDANADDTAANCRCRSRPNPVCLRRLITVAVFLLPWTLCSAAPMSLNHDTPAGNHTAIVNTRRRHQHFQRNNQNHHQKQQENQKQNEKNDERKHSNSEGKKTMYDDHIMKAATTNMPVFVSDLVAFSKERPPMPPWDVDEMEDSKYGSNKNTEGVHRREKREKRSAMAPRAVCDDVHSWVRKQTATDIYGTNITVMDKILTNGGQQVTQWFYETKCIRTEQASNSCRGIDTYNWDSECLDKESFVYAMVRTSAGEEGWNWIAIKTACNCALRMRPPGSRGMNRRAPYPFVGLTTER